jgi:hypothetical protein
MLSDLEEATGVLEQAAPASTATLKQIDHAAALRHTVDVLERTKQNFKSRDLAELRKQLEALLTNAPA